MQKELKQRILSSVILIPIVFYLIIKGSYFFSFLLLISIFISLYEWHLLARNKNYYILGVIFLLCSFYSIYQIRISFFFRFTHIYHDITNVNIIKTSYNRSSFNIISASFKIRHWNIFNCNH